MVLNRECALGAWTISRLSGQLANPLHWYALTEGVIGIFGLDTDHHGPAGGGNTATLCGIIFLDESPVHRNPQIPG
jgi:hypothetical protein